MSRWGSRGRGLSAVALAVLATAFPGAQDRPVFRSGVQVVEVDVRVFDKDGRFVTDLKAEDFEIRENGVPQPIRSLFLVQERGTGTLSSPNTQESVPVPLSPRESVPVPLSEPQPRQTWVFVFDLNHLTPGAGFERAREAVETFIREQFRDGDLGGVVAGARMVNNRLTSVREELVTAVKSVKPAADQRSRQFEITREWPKFLDEGEVFQVANEERDAIQRVVDRACREDPPACRRTEPDLEVRQKARRLFDAMQRSTLETLKAVNALASGLAKIPGPKTVVLLSNGFVAQRAETTLQGVAGQLARGGARVYAIDVRGLNRSAGAGNIEQDFERDLAGAPPQLDVQSDGVNSLAVDTGGLMIRNENNIRRALNTIAGDSNRYYVLAYQPTNAAFDGKFRSIDVQVKRDAVRVRARRGYLALDPARMLVPQPIAAPSEGAGTRDERTSTGTPVVPEPSPEPVPTTAGSVVGGPARAEAGSVRLRPDANARVKELSVGENAERVMTAGAGDAAAKGWDAYQRGDVEAALPLLESAAARPDVRPWVLYALGFAQVALGRHADAAASWERVRQAAPDFQSVYMDLADAYVQVSDLSRALAILREAEKRWPADADAHNAIGVIHVRRGALDEAIASFEKAAAAAPGEALAHLNLGRTYELRYARGRRYVKSQQRWVASEEDRRKAAESYQRCVQLGGPYARQAAEALSKQEWTPK